MVFSKTIIKKRMKSDGSLYVPTEILKGTKNDSGMVFCYNDLENKKIIILNQYLMNENKSKIEPDFVFKVQTSRKVAIEITGSRLDKIIGRKEKYTIKGIDRRVEIS